MNEQDTSVSEITGTADDTLSSAVVDEIRNHLNESPLPVVTGGEMVSENIFGVREGQVWDVTDARRPRQIRVVAVDVATGVARVVNTVTQRRAKIRLERFSPSNHMRKA